MNSIHFIVRSALALSIWMGCLAQNVRVAGAQIDSSVPSVIQAGFELWPKTGPNIAVDTWRMGGLMQNDNALPMHVNYLKEAQRALGAYKSYELIQSREIGRQSKFIYLSINFQRGAVYARFLMYRAERDWVVQSMAFDTKPESLMPWLALAGEPQN